MSLLLSTEECARFSFSQAMPSSPVKSSPVINDVLDSAIIDEDRDVGLLYEHLFWDSPHFDNMSESCDGEYLTKVHKLVTNEEDCWSDIIISPQA